ncbi:MAG: hypothetical protein AAGD25_12880 [Cyanobacteria bacterium P01_F01_bin.150]
MVKFIFIVAVSSDKNFGAKGLFDYGAQFFMATDPRWQTWINQLVQQGIMAGYNYPLNWDTPSKNVRPDLRKYKLVSALERRVGY